MDANMKKQMWEYFKWNPFAALVVNTAGHSWSRGCVHHISTIDH
jgi:hypothetical protein